MPGGDFVIFCHEVQERFACVWERSELHLKKCNQALGGLNTRFTCGNAVPDETLTDEATQARPVLLVDCLNESDD